MYSLVAIKSCRHPIDRDFKGEITLSFTAHDDYIISRSRIDDIMYVVSCSLVAWNWSGGLRVFACKYIVLGATTRHLAILISRVCI